MEKLQEFKKCAYSLWAQRVEPGTKVYNFLEDVYYVADENKGIRLTGTVGEEWLIDAKKLAKTYSYYDGSAITIDSIPSEPFMVTTIVDDSAPTVFAVRTTKQEEVKTSWGDVLTANRDGIPHGDGDFIVHANKDGQADPDDGWVVNGLVFANTYTPV